ncbi:hypothetical protein PTT_11480 [Pyrenophora teres f. teres 0-1]|uniref:RING-type domain-containing protein n=2 Tax=Pyrenophora teres f. teres TaxID=97479 RepID=E3RRM6_PYRTT|nr:hypothetical protein PTT_11480 [Pyrenophora teres f. teres 0-1]CAE7219691.1 zf-RING-2 domain containing protein [Pyrenophora teres f. teres]
MFRRARDYFNLIGETVPPNSSRKEAKAQIRKFISTKPRTDRAIKLAGNVAFERWYDNNNDAEQSAGDDCNRNDASTTKNPNPPLRLLRQSAGPHMCIKCASTVDVKDVQQNDDFRLALQARLSLGDPDQVSSSNLSTVENNQELSLSRSVVLERGVHYAEALSMYQPGTNANQEANEEHPNIGPESKVPNRLDPQAFPLYMLACDHIICRACLLYNFSWWHQNAVCPMCQHELVKTGHFYYRNMMADKTTVLALPSEDSSLDDKLFHKAMDVHNAFVKANDKPFIILTTWACELLAHIVAEHLMTQYQEGGSGHSSKDMTHEALSQSVQSSSVKHVLEIASETLHISFQKLFRLHAKDVPCIVSATGLKATMLRHVRKAVQEPIACICRRLFSRELVQAGLKLDSLPREIFQVATIRDGTRMGELWRVCEMFVEYTVAWLVWRHVTADPDYTATLTQIAVPMGC